MLSPNENQAAHVAPAPSRCHAVCFLLRCRCVRWSAAPWTAFGYLSAEYFRSWGIANGWRTGNPIQPFDAIAEALQAANIVAALPEKKQPPVSSDAIDQGDDTVSQEMIDSIIEASPGFASRGARGLTPPGVNLAAAELAMMQRINRERDPARRALLERDLKNFQQANRIRPPISSGGPNAEFRAPGLTDTLTRIARGESFPHRNDGSVFQNREGLLPRQAPGYYREYVVPTQGSPGPGAQRVVIGQAGEVYCTTDHYRTFVRVPVGGGGGGKQHGAPGGG